MVSVCLSVKGDVHAVVVGLIHIQISILRGFCLCVCVCVLGGGIQVLLHIQMCLQDGLCVCVSVCPWVWFTSELKLE